MEETFTAKEVLAMLEKQSFADFYNYEGAFDRYISGDNYDPVTKEEVLKLLTRLLKREKVQ